MRKPLTPCLLNRIALIQDLEDLLDRKVDVAKPEILHECIREQVYEGVKLKRILLV